MKSAFTTAAIALSLALSAGPAAADDGLSARAISAAGAAIASQGNAALAQIREEIKDTLLDRIAPYLPQPAEAPVAAPAERAESTR